jgi:hypothetical protein
MELNGLSSDAVDLTRWGTGRVVLLHGPFVLPRSSTPNPSAFSFRSISQQSCFAVRTKRKLLHFQRPAHNGPSSIRLGSALRFESGWYRALI